MILKKKTKRPTPENEKFAAKLKQGLVEAQKISSLKTPNAQTIKAIKEVEKGGLKEYKSVKALLKDLNK